MKRQGRADPEIGDQTSGRHRTLRAATPLQQTGPTAPESPPPGGQATAQFAAGSPLPPWDADRRLDALEAASQVARPEHPGAAVIYDRELGPYPALAPDVGLHATRELTRAAVAAAVGPKESGAFPSLMRRKPTPPAPLVIPGAPRAVGTSPRASQVESTKRWSPSVRLVAGCVALLIALVAAGTASHAEITTRLPSMLWMANSEAQRLPTPIGGYWDPPIASTAPAPPSFIDAGHYVQKYGFDWPAQGGGLWSGEQERLANMMPFAIAATARWNARHGDALEPQMLLFWTHAEGISGRISYSNCANEAPPAGTTYFTHIANCDVPNFWQLGFGNQFGVIAVLKTAFTDMRGDPNDARLVQRVGQAVLDWDRRQGTTPPCGGYSCTFPTMTIDQIMAGVSLSQETPNDWWASVLSRDPAINCYMLADALVWFSHAETRYWVGCYYAEPCWGDESNRLGEVLSAWNGLLAAAHL